jgi:hypothetical protein
VANEVKELARETAEVTEDIAERVLAIQGDTTAAVAAIDEISAIVAQISDRRTTIASAVEEQTATTSEMSRSVQEAANGTGEIAANITGVSRRRAVPDGHRPAGHRRAVHLLISARLSWHHSAGRRCRHDVSEMPVTVHSRSDADDTDESGPNGSADEGISSQSSTGDAPPVLVRSWSAGCPSAPPPPAAAVDPAGSPTAPSA